MSRSVTNRPRGCLRLGSNATVDQELEYLYTTTRGCLWMGDTDGLYGNVITSTRKWVRNGRATQAHSVWWSTARINDTKLNSTTSPTQQPTQGRFLSQMQISNRLPTFAPYRHGLGVSSTEKPPISSENDRVPFEGSVCPLLGMWAGRKRERKGGKGTLNDLRPWEKSG